MYEEFGTVLGSVSAVLFALALLASGLASSSVGTYAGGVILDGFGGRRSPLVVRRLVARVPALGILALGGNHPGIGAVPGGALIQIPFALWPLVLLTRDWRLMGDLVNGRIVTAAALLVAGAVTVLKAVLIVLLLS